jgi:precorrin-2 dehydrogenase/sirohydrochlorin ferrochelatase
MLPVMLDVARMRCVVVGAGPVGARKARALIDAGATDVTLISIAFDPATPAGVMRVQQAYREGMLAGAKLVFACTDRREVNDAVVEEARSIGAIANRADAADDASGDFTTMALIRRGAVVVAVSGGSAAVTAAVKDEIDRTWPGTHVAIAKVARDLRPTILRSSLSPAGRTALLRWFTSEEALSMLRDRGEPALREHVDAQLRLPST